MLYHCDHDMLLPNKQILIKEENKYLPNKCHIHDLVCHASHGVFVWSHNAILKCQFQFIRQSTLHVIDETKMVDWKHKILLSIPTDQSVIECYYPHRLIKQTTEGVWYTTYLSHENKCYQMPHKKFKCKEMYQKLENPSLHEIFLVSFNFILYELNTQLGNNHKDISANHCELSNRLTGDLIHVTKNIFFRSLGDALAVLTCPQKKVHLLTNATVCYQDLQVNNDLFIDPNTHLLKKVSTRRQCNPHLPSAIIQTANQSYMAQEPNLMEIKLSSTTIFNDFDYMFNNETTSLMGEDDGLLTNDEWIMFEDDLYHKNLQTAITSNFINHLCDQDQSCSGTMTEPLNLRDYDISKLIYKQTHPLDTIVGKLRDYTLEICMVTLFIQGTIFLLTIVDLVIGNNPNNTIRLLGVYVFRLFRSIILLCYPKLAQNEDNPTDTVEMAPLRRRQSLL